MFQSSISTGKLLVTYAAAFADPSMITGSAATVETLSMWRALSRQSPDLKALSDELDTKVTRSLKASGVNKADMPRYKAMLEDAAPHMGFAGAGLKPAPIRKAIEQGLKAKHHDNGQITALSRALEAPLATLCNDPRLTAAIQPQIMREVLARLADLKALKDAVERLTVETSPQARDAGIKEGMLLALAQRYAEGNPTDFQSALAGLEQALQTAAREHQRDALPSNLGEAVDKIIAQVEALNDAGDLDAADDALEAEMARRAEERARQKAEDARVIEKAIAQATYRRDAEALAKRSRALVMLESPDAEAQFNALRADGIQRREDGLRYGTPFALEAAIGLAQECITIAPTPYLRAMAQNELGIYCQELGQRTAGEAGAALLARAVEVYEAALTVRSKAEHPVGWAMTQNNLAAALSLQAQRTRGDEATTLLSSALSAYDASLTVRTKTEHPVDWAMTKNNLANSLSFQAQRTSGEEAAALLSRAVEAYEAALTVRTEAEHPVDWATTQNNLANTLGDQAQRTRSEEAAPLLARAVEAYEAALTVYTKAEHPVDWAMIQNNIAAALMMQARSTSSGDEASALLASAVEACEAALTVRTRADHPLDWATTQNNLASALGSQALRSSGDEAATLLARAIEAFDSAMTIRNNVEQPHDFAETQENLALLHAKWSLHENCDSPATHLQTARAHVETALEIYDPEHTPYDHETATRLRDEILAALEQRAAD